MNTKMSREAGRQTSGESNRRFPTNYKLSPNATKSRRRPVTDELFHDLKIAITTVKKFGLRKGFLTLENLDIETIELIALFGRPHFPINLSKPISKKVLQRSEICPCGIGVWFECKSIASFKPTSVSMSMTIQIHVSLADPRQESRGSHSQEVHTRVAIEKLIDAANGSECLPEGCQMDRGMPAI